MLTTAERKWSPTELEALGCIGRLWEHDEAQGIADQLAYGWPSRQDDPTPVRAAGRFAKPLPLIYCMGVGDPGPVGPAAACGAGMGGGAASH